MRQLSIVLRVAIAVLFAMVHAYASIVTYPTIELSQLEQIGLAGPYGGVSMYTDTRQLTQIQPSTASVLSYDQSIFELVASTAVNGSILASCQLGSKIYIAGSFNINRNLANIAAIDINSRSVVALGRGLDGPVYSLLCDTDTQNVYAGGTFLAPVADAPDYANSLAYYGGNVAVWSNNTWNALPWKGFDGPVYAITKNIKGQSILFGGKFDSTADGQLNYAPASQRINLASSTVVSAENTDLGSNPSNILCGNASKSTPWILKGETQGYWEVQFAFSIHPSLFRLSNVHASDYGTKEFSIVSLITQEPYLLSYLDPVTGQALYCTTNCTLSNDPSVQSQDFRVLNSTLTSGVRVNIASWYNNGAGLASIDVFQEEIFVHAVNDYNAPNCSSSTPVSSVKTTGTWEFVNTGGVLSKVLSTSFPASQLQTSKVSVEFIPALPESGYYDIYFYTPACTDTTACEQRTKVDVATYLSTSSSKSVTLNQNTAAERYDIVYSGYINVTAGDSFQPYVLLNVAQSATKPKEGSTINVVASAIQLVKRASDSSLSSILEYSLQNATWSSLTENVPYQSTVNVMETTADGSSIFIGGNFSLTGQANATYANLIRYDTTAKSIVPLRQVGPDGPVNALCMVNSDLYIGGSFVGIKGVNSTTKLNNVARYNTEQNTWNSLSGGVNGPVAALHPVQGSKSILVSGSYSLLLDTSGASVNVSAGNTWWTVGKKSWDVDAPFVSGTIYGAYSQTEKDGDTEYFVGNIKSAQRFASDGFSLVHGNVSFVPVPFYPDPKQTFEVRAGVFWNDTTNGNQSTVIVGGTFQLDDTTHNIAILEGGSWTGIGADWQGQVNTMVQQDNILYIGGQFSGPNTNNLAIYDLANKNFTSVPDLHMSDGSEARINIIRYNTADQVMVMGGSFSTAGSLTCKGVCTLDTLTHQWNNLGSGIDGEVLDFIFADNKMVVAGDLKLNDVPVPIAQYDYQQNGWSTLSDSDDNTLPGTSLALSYDEQTKMTFIAGQTADMTAYLRVWDGQKLTAPEPELGPGSQINQLMVLPTKQGENMTNLMSNPDAVLLVNGFLNLGSQGNVSAALFNGSHWIPYIVASAANGSASAFNSVFFNSYAIHINNTRYLPTPVVILVSIASSLGVVFLIVLSSLGVVFLKRRRESRVDPSEMPAGYYNKPPRRPESLIEMLNSSPAVAGLYGLEKDPGMDNESTTVINEGPAAYPNKFYREMEELSVPAAAAFPPPKNLARETFHSFNRPDSDIRPISEAVSAQTPDGRTPLYFPSDTLSSQHMSNNPFRQSAIIGLALSDDTSEHNSIPGQARLTNVPAPVASMAHTVNISSAVPSWEPASMVHWSTVGNGNMDTAVISYNLPPSSQQSESREPNDRNSLQTTHTNSEIVTGDVHWQTHNAKDALGVATIIPNNQLLQISSASDGFASDPDLQQWIHSSDPKEARWTTAPSDKEAISTAIIVQTSEDEDQDNTKVSTNQVPHSQLLPFFAANDTTKMAPMRLSNTSALFDTESTRGQSGELRTSMYTKMFADHSPAKDSVLLNTKDNAPMTVTIGQAPMVVPSSVKLEKWVDVETDAKHTTDTAFSHIGETDVNHTGETGENHTGETDVYHTEEMAINPGASEETLVATSMKSSERLATSDSGLALDGRAASKRMVEEYQAGRERMVPVHAKKPEYSASFRKVMEEAKLNNLSKEQATEKHPHLYYAKFEFKAREVGELGFDKGDPIIVLSNEDDIWWLGFKYNAENDDGLEKGVFPSNYIERAS